MHGPLLSPRQSCTTHDPLSSALQPKCPFETHETCIIWGLGSPPTLARPWVVCFRVLNLSMKHWTPAFVNQLHSSLREPLLGAQICPVLSCYLHTFLVASSFMAPPAHCPGPLCKHLSPFEDLPQTSTGAQGSSCHFVSEHIVDAINVVLISFW